MPWPRTDVSTTLVQPAESASWPTYDPDLVQTSTLTVLVLTVWMSNEVMSMVFWGTRENIFPACPFPPAKVVMSSLDPGGMVGGGLGAGVEMGAGGSSPSKVR